MKIERFEWVLALTLAGFLMVQGPATASQHSEKPDRLGDTLWPPEGHQSYPPLVDLVRPLYAEAHPAVIGVNPIGAFQIERVNGTASRVTIEEQGGPVHEFNQSHDPVDGSGGLTLAVRPSQLRSTIEVRPFPETHTSQILHLYGPPGAFNVTGNTTEEKLQTIQNVLKFPEPVEIFSDPDVESALPLLYHGKESCLEESAGECTTEAYFQMACRNCTQVSFGVSGPDEEFRQRFGTDPRVGTGLSGGAVVLLGPDGDVISVSLGLSFDLNESAVLDPSQARDSVIDDIHKRGYRLGDLTFDSEPGASFVDEARLELELPDGRVEPVGASYVWQQIPVLDPPKERSDDPYGDEYFGNYVQDAQTGEILNATFRPASVTSGPDNPLPAPGLGLLLAATAAAALAWRRRRRT